MDWIERLNSAVNYIEENITEEIDYEQLARIACCSSYHFQRMFSFMAEVPLSEYIRRRKMTLAAVDLQGGMKVIDAAMKYGYNSPTAFNRAFQAIHGVTPSSLKNSEASVKFFPPITFRITVKGAVEMNYRIENKEAFRIVGVSIPLSKDIEENHKTIPQKWSEARADGTLRKLIRMMNSEPEGILGICISETLPPDGWKYYIAAASTSPAGDFEEYTVPAAEWAVFSGSGTSESIQQLEQRIYTEWMPSSGYEYANAVELEVYLNDSVDNMQYEVWIPVTRKK